MSDNVNPTSAAPEGSTPASRRSAAYYGPAPYRGPHYSGEPMYSHGAAAIAPYGQASGAGGNNYGYGQNLDDSESLLGAVTITRMLRVCAQRWMTIAVVAVAGAVVAYFVYRSMPSIYEASSTFEMSLRPKKIIASRQDISEEPIMYGQSDEIFNTRIVKLTSSDVRDAVRARYRSEHPNSPITDAELQDTLANRTDVALQRRTRLVHVTVRSTSLDFSTDLANAYVMAVDDYIQKQNHDQAENAVKFLDSTVAAQKRDLEKQDKAILDFRSANQFAIMDSDRREFEAAQLALNADAVKIGTDINHVHEILKLLETTNNIDVIPDSVPNADALAKAHQKLQEAVSALTVDLTTLEPAHPKVRAEQAAVEQLQKQFADEVAHARDTAKANLNVLLGQLKDNRERCEKANRQASELEQRIVAAKVHEEALLREREVAQKIYEDTLNRQRDAKTAADENATTITIVEKAKVAPDEKDRPPPVSPNPFIILPTGPAIGILAGILFVLLLDNLEDKITGISDIEHRIRLKVLSVLPHIRRAKRDQVAMLSAEDRFSHFAEAFAGLRNMLDSPRYANVSKALLVVSTQPGEGKTITASNFALSCAMAGQRTVLIDFDLRRPRLARIFKKSRKDYTSLFHTLSAGDTSRYSALPVPSGYANLDLICTRPSAELSPSNLLGSSTVATFIDWARQNYDRVVIDSPPFGLVSDAVVLGTLVDGIVVMCCPDRTRFHPLKHAVRHLSEAGGHLIGVVVNDVDFGRAGMFGRYEYHYNYSYRYKYGGKYGYGRSERVEAAAKPEDAKDGAPPTPTTPTTHGRSVSSAQAVEDDDDE